MNIKVSDFVAKFLVSKKLVQMFGVTGGSAMHLNESFRKENKINFIYTHHEQTAAMAAESYFREINRPAVIHTTSGPGGVNAILSGNGSDFNAELEYLPSDNSIKDGYVVYTSGIDGRISAAIPVGKVFVNQDKKFDFYQNMRPN